MDCFFSVLSFVYSTATLSLTLNNSMETMVIMTEKMALQQHSEKIQQLLEDHAIELNQVIKETLTVHLKNPAPTQQRSFSLKSLSMKKPN
jgi:hypothetical protein